MPIAHHVMLRTEERRVLAPSVMQRRALAAAVHEVAGAGLLAFRGSDTHVHLLLLVGFGSDPWHDASVLPDLLGLRVLGGDVRERVRERLPRVDRRRLLEILGVEALHAGADLAIGVEAAAAAVARADLSGKARCVVAARRTQPGGPRSARKRGPDGDRVS